MTNNYRPAIIVISFILISGVCVGGFNIPLDKLFGFSRTDDSSRHFAFEYWLTV